MRWARPRLTPSGWVEVEEGNLLLDEIPELIVIQMVRLRMGLVEEIHPNGFSRRLDGLSRVLYVSSLNVTRTQHTCLVMRFKVTFAAVCNPSSSRRAESIHTILQTSTISTIWITSATNSFHRHDHAAKTALITLLQKQKEGLSRHKSPAILIFLCCQVMYSCMSGQQARRCSRACRSIFDSNCG